MSVTASGSWPSHGHTFSLLRIIALALACAMSVPAPAAEITGDSIAQAVHDRADGRDAVTRGTMTLDAPGSRTRIRKTYTYQLNGNDNASKSLVRFSDPANIADTGLLVHNHADGTTDQWLYLPAASQVRRISSENLGGNFVQSDLFFEDLQVRLPAKDTHTFLGMDTIDGVDLYRLQSIPASAADSAYTRRLSWIHPDTMIPLRIDFFQGGEEPVKRLEVLRIENIQGYWTVMASTMTTLRTGHTTRMEVEAITYDLGLPDDLFSIRTLSDPFLERKFRN